MFWSKFLSTIFVTSILAANPGIAEHVTINEENVLDGHLLSLVNGEYILSQGEYDFNLVGVVELDPAIELDLILSGSSFPILTSGQVEVLVNESNGSIKKGDSITGSATPGIGMKSTQNFAIIGQALSDLEVIGGKNQVGKIPVVIKIQNLPTETAQQELDISQFRGFLGSIGKMFRFVDPQEYDEPTQIFRYILSSVVLLFSLMFGFSSFSKLARSGIEAIGRNPLASKMITIGILLNVTITITIIGAGFWIAYYILTI